MSEISENPQEIRETGRIEAFSDGVFAIVITLLAFEIKVPPLSELREGQGLLSALIEQWPVYLGFLISFGTIAIMWINHHAMFKNIQRIDHRFLVLNTLLLMMITLVPFSTLLLTEYLEHKDAAIGAIIFSGDFFLIAVFFNLMWFHASRDNRLLAKDADRALVEGITKQYRFGPVFYLVSMGLALISVPASLAVHFVLAAYFTIPGLAPRPGS